MCSGCNLLTLRASRTKTYLNITHRVLLHVFVNELLRLWAVVHRRWWYTGTQFPRRRIHPLFSEPEENIFSRPSRKAHERRRSKAAEQAMEVPRPTPFRAKPPKRRVFLHCGLVGCLFNVDLRPLYCQARSCTWHRW